jgi:manganese-dependent inorganic pyrophosphatase
MSIAQIESVGNALADRQDELLDALRRQRDEKGYALSALMVTDIVAKETELLSAGDRAAVERAFGEHVDGGAVSLPGVMSRKKQVAPKLLSAMAG